MTNPNIILAGQPVDIVGALDAGNTAGQRANLFAERNALAQMMRAQGPAIMQGDQNALNALARIGPSGFEAAQGVQDTLLDRESVRLNMDATRTDMRLAEQREARLGREEKRLMAEHVADMTAAQAEQERLQLVNGLSALGQIKARGDTPENRAMFQQFAEANDMENIGWDEYEPQAALISTEILPIYESALERNAGPEPADEYGRYVAEERAAGREPLSRIDFAQAKKGEGIVVTNADGSQIRIGGAAGSEGRIQPSSPDAMLATIDGILNDPALNISTGVLSPLQSLPGTPQRRFGARARQLEGQAFLQAFESLKGGGQITEVEGLKATQAIGRLDTAQSADDYRDALTELRDILVAAQSRPAGWAETQQRSEQVTPEMLRTAPEADVLRLIEQAGGMGKLSDDQLQAIMERAQ